MLYVDIVKRLRATSETSPKNVENPSWPESIGIQQERREEKAFPDFPDLPRVVSTGGKEMKLEGLLMKVIEDGFKNFSLSSEVKLKSEGTYKLFGKTWEGKVVLTLKPQKPEEKEKQIEKRTEEEIEKPF